VFGFWRHGRAHTIRTPQYRLTQWAANSNGSPLLQTELYSVKQDPDETVNVAAQNPAIVEQLANRLRKTVPLWKMP
jgi:hypothetical protein